MRIDTLIAGTLAVVVTGSLAAPVGTLKESDAITARDDSLELVFRDISDVGTLYARDEEDDRLVARYV